MYPQPSFPSSGRGGFAPRRGHGGGQSRHPNSKRKEPEGLDRTKHPLGEILKSFSSDDLKQPREDTLDAPQITDCKYITSYNWTASTKPTIIVPGKPPRWTPMPGSHRLTEDNGSYFRDPNAARYPDYPTAPAVRAILHTNPTFPTSSIDIFACGSTLGNLLRFVRAIDKPFRFNVECVGNTVFFVRKENDQRELLKGVRGYGHTFPEAYTTWERDVKDSEDNQRVVQYKFGNFNCIVRFECDGYIAQHGQKQPDGASNDGDILQLFEATSIGAAPPHLKTTDNSHEDLIIKSGGSLDISQSSIFDLKTRSNRYGREIDMSDITPTLWVKQVPNFIIAYHDGRGFFEDKNIKVQDVRADVRAWELDNKQAIQRFFVLLDKIVDIARTNERGLLEVCCSSSACIEIRDQYGQGKHVLPASWMEKWANKSQKQETSVPVRSSSVGPVVWGKTNDAKSPERFYASLTAEDSEDEENDYTACSAECGYCGKCTY